MTSPDALDRVEPAGGRRWSILITPRDGTPEQAHNWRAGQREALSFGAVEGIYAFVAVLLARLGATNVQVGLLTALPCLAVFLLAAPFGSFVQSRRNAVPWYSRGRAIGQLLVPGAGLAVLFAPADMVIPAILAIVAVCSVFQAFADLVFWVVMDGVAGPDGRYELMGHRLGLKMGVSAATQAGVGTFLSRAPFPLGYGLAFVAAAIPVGLGFRSSRTLRIADHPPQAPRATVSTVRRVTGMVAEVAGERRFLAFMGAHTLFAIGVKMALPLIPLWYVRELDASDAFIGIIGTVSALLTMAGYFLWRRPARRLGARVLVPTALGVACLPLLLTLAHTDLAVAAIVGLAAFSGAGWDLGIFDALMNTVPGDRSVRFAALDTGAVNFAGVVAPLMGAVLASAWGLGPAMVTSGVVGIMGAICLPVVVLGARHRSSSTRRGR